MNPSVRIVEVGPRDGLQNISQNVSTAIKVELIQRLVDAGLRTVELTSVVSPKAVPQLKDCREVLQSPEIRRLLQGNAQRLPVLVPNIKGLNIASQCGVSEIAVFISATEGFSKANIRCTVDEGIARSREVVQLALERGMSVRGYVSCIFADPFDGPTPCEAVATATEHLLGMGCYEVSLGDTLGVGSPQSVRTLITFLKERGIPLDRLAGHFHDTYGQALANVWEAYCGGIRVFDSSVSGLGGCPFAPGAKGNLATEDLVYMLDQAGVSTGVNLAKLVATGTWISDKLSCKTQSRAGAALAIKYAASMKRAGGQVETTKSIPRMKWTRIRETDGLILDRSGANLRVTMNRPKNGNALTTAMMEDLVSTINEAGKDASINRIAITGNGKFFCTGMDLGKGSTAVGKESASLLQYERLTRLFDTIDSCPKTTIACLNGPAFGGGVGLAFACDLRLCAKNARMTLSEAKLGLCPATISKFVIRELGVAFAREAMLTARSISPTELKQRGIIADVAEDPQEFTSLVEAFLTSLRSISTDASRMCKSLVQAGWMYGGQGEQVDVMKQMFLEMMSPTSAGTFGVQEFQAGRKVDWDKYSTNPTSKL
ncbi:hypothetical protein BGZ63DRAFT_504281 [Mariannaea sp. PMI_226]|nr:hypothetical protein BGZ63DRAFT_504281 [Mariannaea sp. PMI_226]